MPQYWSEVLFYQLLVCFDWYSNYQCRTCSASAVDLCSRTLQKSARRSHFLTKKDKHLPKRRIRFNTKHRKFKCLAIFEHKQGYNFNNQQLHHWAKGNIRGSNLYSWKSVNTNTKQLNTFNKYRVISYHLLMSKPITF